MWHWMTYVAPSFVSASSSSSSSFSRLLASTWSVPPPAPEIIINTCRWKVAKPAASIFFISLRHIARTTNRGQVRTISPTGSRGRSNDISLMGSAFTEPPDNLAAKTDKQLLRALSPLGNFRIRHSLTNYCRPQYWRRIPTSPHIFTEQKRRRPIWTSLQSTIWIMCKPKFRK